MFHLGFEVITTLKIEVFEKIFLALGIIWFASVVQLLPGGDPERVSATLLPVT
jgi:hypothetical protein